MNEYYDEQTNESEQKEIPDKASISSMLPTIFSIVLFVFITVVMLGIIGFVTYFAFQRSKLEEVNSLFESEWNFRLEQDPVLATSLGFKEAKYATKLENLTQDSVQRDINFYKKLKEQLGNIDRNSISFVSGPNTVDQNSMNYDFFKYYIDGKLREYSFNEYLMPIDQVRGPQFTLRKIIPAALELTRVVYYKHYLERLESIPTYIDELIARLKKGKELGYVKPAITLVEVPNQILSMIKPSPDGEGDVEDSIFYKPFTKFAENILPDKREELSEDGKKKIKDFVNPALIKLRTFIINEYKGRENIAASNLPNGTQYYEFMAKYYTSSDYPTSEIFRIGEEEVKRLEAEMKTVREDVIKFTGTKEEFDKFLREDERFYASSEDALLAYAREICKRIDPLIVSQFDSIPRCPYGIEKMNKDQATTGSGAFYERPAINCTRAGRYVLNTFDVKARPLYTQEALALHEAMPGHHLQIATQQELEDIPFFRRYAELVSFTEGWALYAESLGDDLPGIYEDPYQKYGALTFSMWRACRLVVDVGIHTKNWTRQEAIDYLILHTSLAIRDATSEVDRYISWPGQALAYKIGETRILGLKRKAKDDLGQRFDIKKFHKTLLQNGPLPLTMLSSIVQKYINATLLVPFEE